MSISNIPVNKSAIFLAGHDPIMQRIILSVESAQTLRAGTVLAKQTITTQAASSSKIVPLQTVDSTEENVSGVETKTTTEAWAILAKDIDLSANENSLALAYVHAEVVADQLIFVSELDEAKLAIVYEQLRKNGIFAVA